MDYPTKQMVKSFCSGKFTQKTADEAWTFFEETAENTLQWAPIKREHITPTVATPDRVSAQRVLLIRDRRAKGWCVVITKIHTFNFPHVSAVRISHMHTSHSLSRLWKRVANQVCNSFILQDG